VCSGQFNVSGLPLHHSKPRDAPTSATPEQPVGSNHMRERQKLCMCSPARIAIQLHARQGYHDAIISQTTSDSRHQHLKVIARGAAGHPAYSARTAPSLRSTLTPSANTFELSVENAVFLVNLLSHTVLGPLVVPNLGPCRLPMTDRSGPRLALIFDATLRLRAGQNDDQG
jgi:hypothetical protein